jgi:deoxycytidine triphosphate deaminase
MAGGEQPPSVVLPQFPASEEEAIARFEATRSKDPLPHVPAALLNTSDLLEYIAQTGMLHPFEVNPGNPSEMLKPASCAMRLGGPCIYWEKVDSGSPVRVERELRSGEELQLPRNSIVYVTLQPALHLPDYIAARFNLTIREIYRGLLVGTGPLVDPGFQGHISVPLHNLTYNDYVVHAGEPIAWMEFTKLSPNERWTSHRPAARADGYVEFPLRKLNRKTVDDYVRRASPVAITSSIPALAGKAERAAEATRKAAQRQLRIFGGVSVLGLLAVVGALAAIVISVYTLVDDSNSSRDQLTRQVATLEHEVAALRAARSRPAR